MGCISVRISDGITICGIRILLLPGKVKRGLSCLQKKIKAAGPCPWQSGKGTADSPNPLDAFESERLK